MKDTMTKKSIKDGDYVLKDGCAWVEVGGVAFRLISIIPGRVHVDAYESGKEMEDPLLRTSVFLPKKIKKSKG